MTCGVPWTILTFNDVGPVLHESNGKIKLFKNLTLPIASFIHEYREVYFGGKNIDRMFTTLNDSLEKQAITVRWSLVGPNGKPVRQESIAMNLEPAESRRTKISIKLPVVQAPATCQLLVETVVADQVVQKDQRKLLLYPEKYEEIKLTSRIATLAVPAQALSRLKLDCQTVDPAKMDLSTVDVLIVTGDFAGAKEKTKIENFVRAGGRLIVLGGSKSPDYLPFTLPMTPNIEPVVYTSDTNPAVKRTIPTPGAASTMTFPLISDHPLLHDLNADLLRFWREDHLTIERSYSKPQEVFSRSVIGCNIGLQQSPLLEVPYGKGLILAVQMPILETFDDQPAARILTSNLLKYTDTYHVETVRSAVGVLADSRSPIPDFLKAMQVEPYDPAEHGPASLRQANFSNQNVRPLAGIPIRRYLNILQ